MVFRHQKIINLNRSPVSLTPSHISLIHSWPGLIPERGLSCCRFNKAAVDSIAPHNNSCVWRWSILLVCVFVIREWCLQKILATGWPLSDDQGEVDIIFLSMLFHWLVAILKTRP